jgi:hypothetical protein
MIQKFFDNFFPRFKIGRIMGFDRGRHWDADAGLCRRKRDMRQLHGGKGEEPAPRGRVRGPDAERKFLFLLVLTH